MNDFFKIEDKKLIILLALLSSIKVFIMRKLCIENFDQNIVLAEKIFSIFQLKKKMIKMYKFRLKIIENFSQSLIQIKYHSFLINFLLFDENSSELYVNKQ